MTVVNQHHDSTVLYSRIKHCLCNSQHYHHPAMNDMCTVLFYFSLVQYITFFTLGQDFGLWKVVYIVLLVILTP